MTAKQPDAIGTPRTATAVRMAILFLGVAGIGISGYLTYVHYQNVSPVCLKVTNCELVLSSPFAAIWGVPMSIFGLAIYSLLTTLGIIHMRAKQDGQVSIALMIYSTALAGTLFSAYLYYLEIFEIHAFCTWCIASSVVMVSILILSLINLRVLGQCLRQIPTSSLGD